MQPISGKKKIVKSDGKCGRIFLDFSLDCERREMAGLARNGRTHEAKGTLLF